MNQTIITRLSDFFAGNAGQYSMEMASLYGSYARGYPKEESDVDLGVLFFEEISEAAQIHYLITDISYRLTHILKKEVNIVVIDRDFSHPMLYYNIIILGLPLYIEDWDKYLTLKLEAIHQMEDFQLFGIPWQRQITRNLLTEVSNG